MFVITASNLETLFHLRITLIFVSTKACADTKFSLKVKGALDNSLLL